MSERGKIKKYDSEKKYGFIHIGGNHDVHFGQDSFKDYMPSVGDIVEFNTVKDPKGLHAKNMRTISQTPKTTIQSSATKYILPTDTQQIIDSEHIDNYALLLNKVSYFNPEKKFIFFKTDRYTPVDIQPNYSNIEIQAIANRHKGNITKSGLIIQSSKHKPTWRMIIGLGNESVYETSMTLHHIYGIPLILGSAIKGVIRSYIIIELFEKNEISALNDQGFCDIFGCPKESYYKESRKGNVTFFDALPISKPNIKPDIMNSHYGDYYSDTSMKVPPADYYNPNPIPFLTVENTEFEFMLGAPSKYNISIKNGAFKGKTPLSIAFNWLKKTLNEHGIGAKTAVGYGYFEEIV